MHPMWRTHRRRGAKSMRRILLMSLTVALCAGFWHSCSSARAGEGWDGKRRISYQQQKDLFYNYYAQPGPFYNTASKMYISPLPVPPNVGHTYTTYQPWMPHEYTYAHER